MSEEVWRKGGRCLWESRVFGVMVPLYTLGLPHLAQAGFRSADEKQARGALSLHSTDAATNSDVWRTTSCSAFRATVCCRAWSSRLVHGCGEGQLDNTPHDGGSSTRQQQQQRRNAGHNSVTVRFFRLPGFGDFFWWHHQRTRLCWLCSASRAWKHRALSLRAECAFLWHAIYW